MKTICSGLFFSGQHLDRVEPCEEPSEDGYAHRGSLFEGGTRAVGGQVNHCHDTSLTWKIMRSSTARVLVEF